MLQTRTFLCFLFFSGLYVGFAAPTCSDVKMAYQSSECCGQPSDKTVALPAFCSSASAPSVFQGLHGINNSATYRTLPAMNFFTKATAREISVAHMTKLPAKQGSMTYPPVMDEKYLYQLIFPAFNDPVGIGGVMSTETLLGKWDRHSLQFLGSISAPEIFPKTVAAGSTPMLRGPLTLNNGNLYLTSLTNAAFAKIDATSMSLVYEVDQTFELASPTAGWTAAIPFMTGTLASSTVETIDGETWIFAGNHFVVQYVFPMLAGPTDFSHFYNMVGEQGKIMAWKESSDGKSVSQMWETYMGPHQLKTGDTIPETSFGTKADGSPDDYVRITYPLIRLVDKDGAILENSLNFEEGAVYGYTFDDDSAGTHKFVNIFEKDGAVATDGKTGMFTFKSGDVLKSDQTITSDDGSLSVEAKNLFLTGFPIIKKIRRGAVLNKYDAYNLNYFGPSFWCPLLYDSVQKRLYAGVGNGHRSPHEDLMKMKETPGTGTDLITLTINVQRAGKGFLHSTSASTQSAFLQAKQDLHTQFMKRQDVIPRMSPRAKRYAVAGLVALDAQSGNYLWHYSAVVWDTFNWGQDSEHYKVLEYAVNADNAVGAAIAVHESIKNTAGRRIFSGDKSGAVYWLDPDKEVKPVFVNPADSREGILTPSVPVEGQNVESCSAGPIGGYVWGQALSVDNSKVFLTCANSLWGAQYMDEVTWNIGGMAVNFEDKKQQVVDHALGHITNKLVRNDPNVNSMPPEATSPMRVQKITDDYSFVPFGVSFQVAISTIDGSLVWQAAFEEEAGDNPGWRSPFLAFNTGPPTAAGELVIQGTTSTQDNGTGKLWFFDGSNGRLLRILSVPGQNRYGAVGTDNLLYVMGGSAGRLGDGSATGKNTQGEYLILITPYGK